MPYNGVDDKSLPSYVKKLPKGSRAKWIAIFNEYYRKEGESMAFKMANGWLKKNLSKAKKEVTGKAGESTTRYYTLTFSIPEEQLVVKAIGDEEYVEAILTDIQGDRDGDSYEESFLYEIADQINRHGIVGDFDHEEMSKLRNLGYSPEDIAKLLKDKKGVAKAIKAIVKNGKLWVRAMIDKRYKKRIVNSKGISIEGLFSKKEGSNTYNAGTVLGFTFAENMTARNPRAGVVY